MMKKMSCGFLIAGSLLISLFAFALDQPDPATQVTRLADAFVKAYTERFPENAAFAGMTLPHNDRFFDNSVAAYRAWEQREDGWLTLFRLITPGAIFSSGYASSDFTGPLPSSGWPSVLTTRPSNPFPTGT